ncbi:MAG: cell division protein ZapA [Bacteroidaceae bacterium]|nr:cell division protein ZapA [Bacteroidaceae bacterium]
MALPEKIQIRLTVGRSIIPLTVSRDKEEVYRLAARAIEEKLGRYRTRYPDQEEERYLAIVLVDFAVRALQAEAAGDTEPYEQLIATLGQELDTLLANK